MADIAHAFTWSIDDKGLLTLATAADTPLRAQPLAILVSGGQILKPLRAAREGDRLTLTYACGEAAFSLCDRGEYLRIEAVSVPAGAQALVFGPYTTAKTYFGGMIGAAWDDDMNAVCIQSLNPKTVGGFPETFEALHPFFGHDRLPEVTLDSLCGSAAVPVEGGAILQCYAQDMSGPALHTVGLGALSDDAPAGADQARAEACEVPGDDAFIPGAAIALITCPKDQLLPIIGRMELREGLPHPTIDGEWVKTSPRATESYLMIASDTNDYQAQLLDDWIDEGEGERRLSFEETLDIIRRAGLSGYYNWKPFVSWGHFEIDPDQFLGGDEGLKEAVDRAREKGLTVGFHTLSNFINTFDPYVTPVPGEDLLIMDTTTLAADIGEDDTALLLSEPKNYFRHTALNCLRVGRELIQFESCEKSGGAWKLLNLTRGAFGTQKSAHAAGEKAYRLQDYGFMTLFPNLKMQREMATRLGGLIKRTGVRRMSFDGLEGCWYTGRGEYASSEFVRRVFELAGSELVCDASIPGHYRWHAHTYHNWGEPFWAEDGRGGMFRYRMAQQRYYTDNFLPHMLGQYIVRLSTPKYEATHPEDFEFILAQGIANDAGFGFDIRERVLRRYGLMEYLLSLIRRWEDMRFHGVIPDSLREAMKDENADWHLEECEGGWTVCRLRKQRYDFGYRTREPVGPANHAQVMLVDWPVPSGPLQMRLRVGQRRNNGQMTYMAFHAGTGRYYPTLVFTDFAAKAGDYLIYTGGTTIAHYDADYRLIETLQGSGRPIVARGRLFGFDLHYALSEGSTIEPFATVFQGIDTVFIPRKSE